ncbi:hypothetical protein PFISCL1PPCAC_18247, partial [Pristionchus fissidentatus]
HSHKAHLHFGRFNMQSSVIAALLAVLLVVATAQEEMQARGWNRASGLWGKRSVPMEEDMMVMDETPEKRSNERSWGKLNNMWGKRAAPVDWDKRGNWKAANGLWGRRK